MKRLILNRRIRPHTGRQAFKYCIEIRNCKIGNQIALGTRLVNNPMYRRAKPVIRPSRHIDTNIENEATSDGWNTYPISENRLHFQPHYVLL